METKFLVILALVIANFLLSLIIFYKNNIALMELQKDVKINQEYLEIHISNLRSRINIILEKQDNILKEIRSIK